MTAPYKPIGRGQLVRQGLPSLKGQPLTAREREVMGLICEGLQRKEIADKLQITRNTVEKHANLLYQKWDVHNTVEVLRYAIVHGHYQLDPWGGNPS